MRGAYCFGIIFISSARGGVVRFKGLFIKENSILDFSVLNKVSIVPWSSSDHIALCVFSAAAYTVTRFGISHALSRSDMSDQFDERFSMMHAL